MEAEANEFQTREQVQQLAEENLRNQFFQIFFSEAGALGLKSIAHVHMPSHPTADFYAIGQPWELLETEEDVYQAEVAPNYKIKISKSVEGLYLEVGMPGNAFELEKLSKEEIKELEKKLAEYGITNLQPGTHSKNKVLTLEEAIDAGILSENESIFEVVDLTTKPKFLTAIRPVYPPHLKRQLIHGIVEVEYIVSETGKAEAIEILDSPHLELSASVVEALQASSFEPGTFENKPVKCRVRQKITFDLKR